MHTPGPLSAIHAKRFASTHTPPRARCTCAPPRLHAHDIHLGHPPSIMREMYSARWASTLPGRSSSAKWKSSSSSYLAAQRSQIIRNGRTWHATQHRCTCRHAGALAATGKQLQVWRDAGGGATSHKARICCVLALPPTQSHTTLEVLSKATGHAIAVVVLESFEHVHLFLLICQAKPSRRISASPPPQHIHTHTQHRGPQVPHICAHKAPCASNAWGHLRLTTKEGISTMRHTSRKRSQPSPKVLLRTAQGHEIT